MASTVKLLGYTLTHEGPFIGVYKPKGEFIGYIGTPTFCSYIKDKHGINWKPTRIRKWPIDE